MRRSNQIGGLDDAGPCRRQRLAFGESRTGNASTDFETVGHLRDVADPVDRLDIDNHIRFEIVCLHPDEKVGAPREYEGSPVRFAQQGRYIRNGFRSFIAHATPPP